MTSHSTLPKRGGNLAERLVSELASEIRRGALRPGDKLPTEAEVVDRFSVSRTVVREELSRLQASGLVETRHGVGTFVAERSSETGFRADAAAIGTVMDVVAMLELRIGVESEAAALAARRRTKPQVKEMRQALDTSRATSRTRATRSRPTSASTRSSPRPPEIPISQVSSAPSELAPSRAATPTARAPRCARTCPTAASA